MPFDKLPVAHAAFDWEAEIRPVYDIHGNEIPAEYGRVVYRGDTPIGRAGPNTALIQHAEVGGAVIQAAVDEGYDIVVRTPGRRDLEDLRGHRGAFLSIDESKNGAIQRGRLILGDFINPTGPSSFLPDGPPTVFREVSWLNSHDSSFAAQVHIRSVNLVCMNGLVSPEFFAEFRTKHTRGVDAAVFKEKFKTGITMMSSDKERMERYIRTPCSHEQAMELFKATVCRLAPNVSTPDEPRWSEAKLNVLMDLFSSEGTNNVWAAYMALTAWATHHKVMRGDALTTRIKRDGEVAATMRSPQFGALLEAA